MNNQESQNIDFNQLINRIDSLLERVDPWLPPTPCAIDWNKDFAARWQNRMGAGQLLAVKHPAADCLGDLWGLEKQKKVLLQNTQQFVAGKSFNHALLWGARGTGKSSLIRALFNHFKQDGLRLIEVDKAQLKDLAEITEPLRHLPYRFMLYCDDLSFESDDSSYKALKVALDGSISAAPNNILIVASSNRRHLLPEYQSENQNAQYVDNEIHHHEAVEEKISLSERFGLWLSFQPNNQAQYLAIVEHCLQRLEPTLTLNNSVQAEALRWALLRGSRSGRVAYQFARHWHGSQSL